MRARPSRLVVPGALALAAFGLSQARPDEPESVEKAQARIAIPFLEKHCIGCHDGEHREGDVVLSPLREAGAPARQRGLLRLVEKQVARRVMPPDDEPQPEAAERDAFLAWVRRAIAEGEGKPLANDPGRVTVRRLNRAEYGYTVLDLLHVAPRPQDEFPADDVGYGFDRIGDVLTVPPLLLERYLQAAESIAQEAILDWKPEKLHADAVELPLHHSQGGAKNGFRIIYSNGGVTAKLRSPWAGEYVLRARAYGEQAGPDPARMALVVDGKEAKRFDVEAVETSPRVYETVVQLAAGEHAIAADFLNDYYKPEDPDPKQRDRNLAVGFIELEGPRERPPLPWAHRTYLAKRPASDAKPAARRAIAREVLAPLASRAFRRPAKPEELERLAKLVDLAMSEGGSFERGIQLALEAILVSPSFIFRFELDAAPEKPGDRIETLDEHALATRLSYFIWSSLPDEELEKNAASSTLGKDLDAQVRRMLLDTKASRLVEQFAVQWLYLRRLDSFAPDPKTFPGFDEELRAAARAETQKLFEAVLRENRSVRDLVDAPFTFVNERLARHYGIEGIKGAEFRRVDVPPERRGLLGHASVLMATSNPTRTSPVKRGRWVLEVLLDDPPPPPLPGADSLKDEGTPVAAKSLRERLEQHRARKECASCHARMDPIGFALERFDAIGALRERDGELELDDRGSLPDGTVLDGAQGLRAYLGSRTRQVARAVAKKLFVFGLGRGPMAADEAALDAVVDSLAPEYKLGDMIVALTKLDAFRKRRVEAGGKVWH